VGGATASIGFLGDGSITLARAAAGQAQAQPTNTPSAPTATSTPRPTATLRATPTPTATPIAPPSLSITLGSPVLPGNKQTIVVVSKPNITVQITVKFPNGDVRRDVTSTDATGRATFTFMQRPNEVTFGHVFAKVKISAGRMPAVATLARKYRIGWSKIDVSVQPRLQKVDKTSRVWVHSKRVRQHVSVIVHFPVGKAKHLTGITDTSGWVELPFTVQAAQVTATNRVISIVARTRVKGEQYRATTTLRIEP
jgi:hypothetical protein